MKLAEMELQKRTCASYRPWWLHPTGHRSSSAVWSCRAGANSERACTIHRCPLSCARYTWRKFWNNQPCLHSLYAVSICSCMLLYRPVLFLRAWWHKFEKMLSTSMCHQSCISSREQHRVIEEAWTCAESIASVMRPNVYRCLHIFMIV